MYVYKWIKLISEASYLKKKREIDLFTATDTSDFSKILISTHTGKMKNAVDVYITCVA